MLVWLAWLVKKENLWKMVAEAAEVAEILSEYGIQPHEYTPVVNSLRKNPKAWLDFMMK